MRVIAGKFKGAKLVSPHGEVRPTTDMVKGSLFSVLASKGLLGGAKVLDVFCGSGALGIEALSRGASSCVFVDADTKNVKANLDKLKISAQTLNLDFRHALRKLKDYKFDLVFCDPPYKTGFAADTLKLIVKYGMLEKNGVVVLEHDSKMRLEEVAGTKTIDSRIFGVSAFEIIGGVTDESGDCGNVRSVHDGT